METIKKCKFCGKEFIPNTGRQMYCLNCASNKESRYIYKSKCKCKYCGKEFIQIGTKRLYCSPECIKAKQEETKLAKKQEKPKKKWIRYHKDDDITVEIRCYGIIQNTYNHCTREFASEKWHKGFDSRSYAAIIYVNGERLDIMQAQKYIIKRTTSELNEMLLMGIPVGDTFEVV